MQGSLNEIVLEDPKSGTTDNTDEDALTKLFGNSKSSRLIGHGRGVTKSKLTIVNMCASKFSKFEEEQQNLKFQITEMMNLFKEHLVINLSRSYINISFVFSNETYLGFILGWW